MTQPNIPRIHLTVDSKTSWCHQKSRLHPDATLRLTTTLSAVTCLFCSGSIDVRSIPLIIALGRANTIEAHRAVRELAQPLLEEGRPVASYKLLLARAREALEEARKVFASAEAQEAALLEVLIRAGSCPGCGYKLAHDNKHLDHTSARLCFQCEKSGSR